ncbi:MAG: hypothetical protein ACC657_13780 [Thiohalomonadales bacterium]
MIAQNISSRFLLISANFLFFLLLSACSGGGGNSNNVTNGELATYQRALSEYKNSNYSSAMNLFQIQLKAYPSGNYADNAHYYEGRSLYAIADYAVAQTQFEIVIQQFSSSSFADSAQYWLAKSLHVRGQFDIAIVEYKKVNTSGIWGDNAAFQLGKIDYDRALIASNPAQAYKNYSDASQKLRTMLDNSIYAATNSIDDAQYYLGRSYQESGNLLLRNSRLSTTVPAITAQQQIDLAQTEFKKIISNSNYFDDANFQLIRIVFEQGKTNKILTQAYSFFETALKEFDAFLNNASYSTGNRIDDAQFFLARSYQEQAYLLLKDVTLSTNATIATACLTSDNCFVQARSAFAAVPTDSIYFDDGEYYTARSYHEAGDYSTARLKYQILIDAATSDWADDAQYQKGKTFYDSGRSKNDPKLALPEFNLAIVEFNQLPLLFAKSNRTDSSLYFKGRSLHHQGLLAQLDQNLLDSIPTVSAAILAQRVDQLFIDARNVYQELIDSDPTSNWSDNAMYRQADSLYDEAVFAFSIKDLANDILAQNNLSQAIGKWRDLLVHPIYKDNNSADDAQYSLGRSYQLAIAIPTANRQTITTGVDFNKISPDLNTIAIQEYNKLITNFQNIDSRWIDNAYYNMGVINHNNALDTAISIINKETALNIALGNFNSLVTMYANSTLLDDTANQIALVYHDAKTGVEYCTAETNWFNYVELKSVDKLLLDNAKQHLVDLNAATKINHSCTPANLTLDILTVPVL